MKKALILLTLLLASVPAEAGTKTWQNGGVDNNYSTAGNWVEGSKPAAGDDVVIAANYAMTLDESTASLNSLDMTGYTNTISGNGKNIIVEPASGTTNLKLAGTISGNYNLYMSASSGAKLQVYANGMTVDTGSGAAWVGRGSSFTGDVYFMDTFTMPSNRTLNVQFGKFHTDGATDNAGLTHSIGFFNSSNSNTRTLTFGNSTITITGTSGNVWTAAISTNLTISTNTATLVYNASLASSPTLQFGDAGNINWNGLSVSVTPSAAGTLNWNGGIFYNITMNFPASKTNVWNLINGTRATNSFTLNGNSVTNRILVKSNALGTSRTITSNTTNSISNADFQDITGAGAASWDLSAITGNSGDCGGNSGITFTTPTTQTASSAASWSWDDAASWTSRVPLPQDDVSVTSSFSSGRVITANMPRLGKSIDLSGITWTGTAPAFQDDSFGSTVYGSFTAKSGMSLSGFNGGTFTFNGRGSETLTLAGNSFSTSVAISMFGGTLTLQDAYTQTTGTLTVSNGSLDSNEMSLTITGAVSITGSSVRGFDISNSTLSISSTTGNTTVFNAATLTNLTSNYTGSTISLSDIGSSGNKTFSGGGGNYGVLQLSGGGGSGAYVIAGSNGFSNFTLVNPPKTIRFTAGTTQTVSNFTVSGTSGNLATLNSLTVGSPATLTKTGGGTLGLDYLSITDINVTPSATWYYGNNSTYVSGTGWNSGNPPSGQAYSMLLGIG